MGAADRLFMKRCGMQTVSLAGYSDKLSGRSGDEINFMVSSQLDAPYEARLFRSISADPPRIVV